MYLLSILSHPYQTQSSLQKVMRMVAIVMQMGFSFCVNSLKVFLLRQLNENGFLI